MDETPEIKKKLDGVEKILEITMTPQQRALLAIYLEPYVPKPPDRVEVHYLRKRKT